MMKDIIARFGSEAVAKCCSAAKESIEKYLNDSGYIFDHVFVFEQVRVDIIIIISFNTEIETEFFIENGFDKFAKVSKAIVNEIFAFCETVLSVDFVFTSWDIIERDFDGSYWKFLS